MLAPVTALHGLILPVLPWEAEESAALRTVRRARTGGPSPILDDTGHAQARRPRTADHAAFSCDLQPAAASVTIESMQLPDTVLAAMAGRLLCEVVDPPGADRLRIVGASQHRTFAHEDDDVRIDVEPIEENP